MDIRTVGIWHNANKPGVTDVAARLARAFERYGVSLAMRRPLAKAIGREDASEDFTTCNLLAVLGGDGTLLSGLDIALSHDIPLLGVNMGRLGFLSEVQPEALEQDIDTLMRGVYSVEERMLIEATAPGCETGYALNDVAVARADGILSVEARTGGASILRFSGDGLIVATPTGSTAYSLSAGGPVIYPGCDCVVLTPVCPHTLWARPVVIPADARVVITALGGAKGAGVTLDGRRFVTMDGDGFTMTVGKAGKTAKFIRMHRRNYFDLLRSKLSDWTH